MAEKKCTCKDFQTCTEQINYAIMLLAMRDETAGYEGKPMEYCAWCGKKLKWYGKLDEETNKEEFDKLYNFVKKTTDKSGLVRSVSMDKDNPLKFHIYAEHGNFIPQLKQYMEQKVEPSCEHIDGEYKIHDARNCKIKETNSEDIIPTDFPHYDNDKVLGEKEIEDLLKDFDTLTL